MLMVKLKFLLKYDKSENQNLARALRYLFYFSLVYLCFICIYSVFYHVYVAKQKTEFLSHIFWWLKSTGMWFLFGPLCLLGLDYINNKKQHVIALGSSLIAIAVAMQLLFDYQHLKHDLIGYAVLYLPKQTGIFMVFYLYWYLICFKTEQPSKINPKIEQKSDQEETITLEEKGRAIALPYTSIHTITSAGNYIEITTQDKRFIKRSSLKDVLALLPNYFCQIHRSAIVNTKQINRFDNGASIVYLNNGEQLKISKRCKSEFKQKLHTYPIKSN